MSVFYITITTVNKCTSNKREFQLTNVPSQLFRKNLFTDCRIRLKLLGRPIIIWTLNSRIYLYFKLKYFHQISVPWQVDQSAWQPAVQEVIFVRFVAYVNDYFFQSITRCSLFNVIFESICILKCMSFINNVLYFWCLKADLTLILL